MDLATHERVDVVVVGGGIVGAFHAWAAARRGLRTVLLERSARPLGASVRNFGMVIPSGTRADAWRQRASYGALIYRELAQRGVLRVRAHGTTYVAGSELELRIFEEFLAGDAGEGLRVEPLSAQATRSLAPPLRGSPTLGGLRFHDDVQVEPREAVDAVLAHLETDLGVAVRRRTAVVRAEVEDAHCEVRTAAGGCLRARHVFVCSGADLATLRPDLHEDSGLRHVKLQMLRLSRRERGFGFRTMLAFAPTMVRYATFEGCASLPALREVIFDPVFDEHGIHVLCAEAADGSLLLGDSHHYAADEAPFDERSHAEVDGAILAYAHARLDLDDAAITHRWIGHYVEREGGDLLRRTEGDRLHVVTAVGGKGMTMAPALAEESLAAAFD